MHNDLHTGNIFIKICDDTLYNGKPLNQTEYFTCDFNYNQREYHYRVPNMGFLVKIGDFGLSTMNINNVSYHSYATRRSLDVLTANESAAISATDNLKKLVGMISATGKRTIQNGQDEVKKYFQAQRARKHGLRNDAMDLNVLVASMRRSKDMYMLPVLEEFRQMEFRAWIADGRPEEEFVDHERVSSMLSYLTSYNTSTITYTSPNPSVTPQRFLVESDTAQPFSLTREQFTRPVAKPTRVQGNKNVL